MSMEKRKNDYDGKSPYKLGFKSSGLIALPIVQLVSHFGKRAT